MKEEQRSLQETAADAEDDLTHCATQTDVQQVQGRENGGRRGFIPGTLCSEDIDPRAFPWSPYPHDAILRKQ